MDNVKSTLEINCKVKTNWCSDILEFRNTEKARFSDSESNGEIFIETVGTMGGFSISIEELDKVVRCFKSKQE